ncbi:MAG: hypothetical protein WD226_03470 [Planctomycetota bacterium]
MIWILSIASMVLGGMTYVLWRPESLTMFSWFSALGGGDVVTEMRGWAAPFSEVLPSWVYLSLPQSLWLFSGCLAIHALWKDSRGRQQRCWTAVIFSLALGGELGQAAGLVPGVFDPLDLALILAALGAAQVIAAAAAGNTCLRAGAMS